jgi:hypothetical protein
MNRLERRIALIRQPWSLSLGVAVDAQGAENSNPVLLQQPSQLRTRDFKRLSINLPRIRFFVAHLNTGADDSLHLCDPHARSA